jgi:hypothetical protein
MSVSQPWDLNPRPTIYETVALPAELDWLKLVSILKLALFHISTLYYHHLIKIFGTEIFLRKRL